jgi:thiosulfate dehydrogenase
VRHGKFYNVGGNMPLFSLEALSDAQLGDILAYLEGFGLPPSQ